ncbi:MAG TPA: hypothetical protein VK963_03760 [Candidatus Saccharimonadales bacterium]|nr:hypothetical protein [Candidatus Saccharimonadales bacterium]
MAALAAQSPDEGSGYLSVFAATNLQACCLFAALQPMDPQRMGLTIYQRSAALDMLIAKFDPNYMHRDDYWQTLEQLYQRLAVGAVSQQELLEGVHRRIELEEAEARSLDRDTCPVCLERDLDFCRVHTGKNRRVKQLKQCLARLAGLRRVERYMAGQLQPTS